MNKACGGDGIPAELFQILKDDAVKVLQQHRNMNIIKGETDLQSRLDAWDSAPGWCTGKTQRDGVGREEGGGIRMGNTCKSMADSC